MLRVTHLSDFLNRVKLAEMKLNLTKLDSAGDFIESFDSGMNFQKLKSNILGCRVCRDMVVDMGLTFIELRDVIYYEGTKVTVGVYAGLGDLGYGSTLRMVVKSIEYYDDGFKKMFLSFRDLNRFLESKTVV